MYACVLLGVCICVIWDSCRKEGAKRRGVHFIILVAAVVEKGGVSPHAIGPVGWFQREWHHNSVPDLLKVAMTSQLSLSVCLFFYPLSPIPRLLYNPFLSASYHLGSFIHIFLVLIYYFFPSLSVIMQRQTHGRRVHQQNETQRRDESSPVLPITQYLEIKAILMNFNVLESSVGPDDVTKRGGKIPPYGRKGTVGPQNPVLEWWFYITVGGGCCACATILVRLNILIQHSKSNRFTKYLYLFIYSYIPGTRMHCMFALNVASAHLHFSNGPHLACQMCLSSWLTSGWHGCRFLKRGWKWQKQPRLGQKVFTTVQLITVTVWETINLTL